MKQILFGVIIGLFFISSAKAQDRQRCRINYYGYDLNADWDKEGKLAILGKTSSVKNGNETFEFKSKGDGVETQDWVEVTYKNGRPIKLLIETKNPGEKKRFPRAPGLGNTESAVPWIEVEFEYRGNVCFEKTVMVKRFDSHPERKILIYSDKFCAQLLKAAKGLTPEEVGKCEGVLRTLVKTVDSFRVNMSKKKIDLDIGNTGFQIKNPFLDVMKTTTACALGRHEPLVNDASNGKLFPSPSSTSQAIE